MSFPEQAREGSEAHASALQRLELARSEQQERSAAHHAAHDTGSEMDTANHLARANEQLAAREAWVQWVERGY